MGRFWRQLGARRGSALMTGLMVMMMVATFGVAYLTLTTNNLLRASRDERRVTAFYLAEAGLEYVIAQIIDEAESTNAIATRTYNTTAQLSDLRSGATGTVQVVASSGSNQYATVTSTATYRGLTETVRVLVRIRNVSVWNNAIFAGVGQSGKGINGNVDIRGSVHILGEGDPFTDLNGNGVRDAAEPFTDLNGNGVFEPSLGETFTDTDGNGVWTGAEPYQDSNLNGIYDDPLTATELATDLSGSANIGNNYAGMPVELSSRIPSLVPKQVFGEWVQTLDAELRVKHGKVNISGSANVGSPNLFGNSVKETMDGCYVNDGWGGNQGASQVYSDNGTAQGYDLGDRVTFPSLFDAYTDASTGMSYSTYEAYLNTISMNATAVPTNASGNKYITPDTPSFSQSDGAGNSISWNQATSTLTIHGVVKIDGILDLGKKSTTMYFAGNGTIFCTSDIKVHGSILPKTRFPTVDTMGCISKRDIHFATGSGEAQLRAAGAWFAQRNIISAKQNQFAGTYVANYFNMGTNVPSIYQVPELVNYLPPGMPGADGAYIAATILSWKHIRPHL